MTREEMLEEGLLVGEKIQKEAEHAINTGDGLMVDYKRQDGGRIVVARLEDGNYLYACRDAEQERFDRDMDFFNEEQKEDAKKHEFNYYAVSPMLIQDLDKDTDNYGRILMNPTARNTIEKNLIGPFIEYISEYNPMTKTYDFHSLWVSIKNQEGSQKVFEQLMAGYDPSRPVSLYHCNFRDRTIDFAGVTENVEKDGKEVVRVATVDIKEDGLPDYEAAEKDLYVGTAATYNPSNPRAMFALMDEVKRKTQEGALNAQETFGRALNSMGITNLPMAEDIYNALGDGTQHSHHM